MELGSVGYSSLRLFHAEFGVKRIRKERAYSKQVEHTTSDFGKLPSGVLYSSVDSAEKISLFVLHLL